MMAEDLNAELDCPICDNGKDPVNGVCAECGGDGIVTVTTMDGATKRDCNACEGTGKIPSDCRRCDGKEYINRFGPEDSSERFSGDVVILNEEISNASNALHVESMPISDKTRGGFNERYGDSIIEDFSEEPVSGYLRDMKDRLANELGESSEDEEYRMPSKSPYEGTVLSVENMPEGKWPEDPDLSIVEVVSWLKGRGDDYTASIFVDLNKDLELADQSLLESIINE